MGSLYLLYSRCTRMTVIGLIMRRKNTWQSGSLRPLVKASMKCPRVLLTRWQLWMLVLHVERRRPSQWCPVRWFRRYINRLLVCLTFFSCILPSLYFLHLLTHLLPDLPTLSIIDPFCFQAGGRRRRPKLALVFLAFIMCCIIYFVIRMHVCFGRVRFCFSALS